MTKREEVKAARAAAKVLAESFVNRAKELEYKGKKRDGAALDFWLGAAAWAYATGPADTADYLTRLAWLISVRGYSEVELIANWDLEQEAT